jgi:hypothetical protein
MSLLREIQTAILEESQSIGPIFLKLRLLASRLGSVSLGEWAKMESEGYPPGIEVPDYRKIGVFYSATFSGPFGSGIKNAPIPSYLIEKYAGPRWNLYELRQGISSIDDLIRVSREGGGVIKIEASNLILILQGKVYEKFACNSVQGFISGSALAEVQHAVRSRILELTIEIEKSIPNASAISLGPSERPTRMEDSDMVTRMTNHIVYGNVTNVNNSGQRARIEVNVRSGEPKDVRAFLIDGGIEESDAEAFSQLLNSEQGGNKDEPFGEKAKEWFVKNIPKAVDGTWKVGIGIATSLLKEAALKYYDLK